jgi:flagella basal body P-ring formation protein FlgA
MRIGILAAAIFAAAVHAGEIRQDPAQVSAAVESFLERESRGLPGQVTIDVGRVDTRLALPACDNLHIFFPAGSRAWGQTSVGARCAAPAWTIYVPARVGVAANYLVAARPLTLGQEVSPADIVSREGDLTEMPAGVLTEASEALGRRLAFGIKPGQPLRRDALREPPVVVQGQPVALIVIGPGFRISAEGRSLGKAPAGESVQVRTASGTVVSGIVRPGPVVEVVR